MLLGEPARSSARSPATARMFTSVRELLTEPARARRPSSPCRRASSRSNSRTRPAPAAGEVVRGAGNRRSRHRPRRRRRRRHSLIRSSTMAARATTRSSNAIPTDTNTVTSSGPVRTGAPLHRLREVGRDVPLADRALRDRDQHVPGLGHRHLARLHDHPGARDRGACPARARPAGRRRPRSRARRRRASRRRTPASRCRARAHEVGVRDGLRRRPPSRAGPSPPPGRRGGRPIGGARDHHHVLDRRARRHRVEVRGAPARPAPKTTSRCASACARWRVASAAHRGGAQRRQRRAVDHGLGRLRRRLEQDVRRPGSNGQPRRGVRRR